MSGKPLDPYRATVLPAGNGAMGELIRALDWAATPLGAIAAWPGSLVTTVETLLGSQQPMFLWWGPELIQFYNDAYVPSFGRGKHPRALGQRGAECWPEIWPIIGPQIAGVMTSGTSTWHEDALVPIHRNERIEEVYWTYGYSPIFDAGRRVAGCLVVCTETTSRVLSERRQRLFGRVAERATMIDEPEALLESAFASFASAGADIPFAAAYDATATTMTQVIGVREEDLDRVRSIAAQLTTLTAPARLPLDPPLTAGPWPEPVREVFAVPVAGRGTHVFGISSQLSFDAAYRDFLVQLVEYVTLAQSRSEAFAARAAIEAERRDLLLQAPVATALLTGPAHRFELANELYVEMVGRSVVGKTYLEAFPELADSALPAILDEVFQRGTPFVSNEMLIRVDCSGSGTPQDRYFKFNLQPIRDVTGAVFGMMAIAVDITEGVRARQEQVAALARLQEAHDERTDLVRELEQASRAKDEFLAMLGHELRNPLAPIVTALHLLKARESSTPSPEHKILERQVEHLTRLVDDLLDVSKITRGKVELKKELVELGDVITKAIEMAGDLEDREHRFTVDVPREPIRWWGDPVRLAQVVANLLTNAARYTAPGGAISLRARRDGHWIEISVVDNGIGIAPELLPHIFKGFVQGRRSSDRAQGGLGIGLTLVENLVALHGGSVTAASAGEGQGSQFVVRLPVADMPAAARAPAPAAPGSSPPRRILVVDDNVDAASLLAELLGDLGHEVAIAHDAHDALDMFPVFAPEVAILDIGLPVMDGYELAVKLRERGATPPCRLVAVTGYGQEGDRARALAAGFDLHLVKPVDLTALLAAIAGTPT
ncbi:MAG: ATP-binding protein [Myxococcota bacterium]|nr:ATP-binding protein [Myxococcota bacterium]